MSKMSKEVKNITKENSNKEKGRVENFMGGYSYEINPLDTMKMVTASSIFGEPQYYIDGKFCESGLKREIRNSIHHLFAPYSMFDISLVSDKTTKEIMEEVIDDALEYDFEATLRWAKTLREDYFMRLNPQVIMVRAAMSKYRAEFTEKHPGLFDEINQSVMRRCDDPLSQLTYYLYINKSKNNLPGILKKSIKKRLEKARAYELKKYKNKEIGVIDAVRITHANSKIIDELMQTGNIKVEENDLTWENLRAGGKSWTEILDTIKMNHMALLRNLRGIFKEIDDLEKTKEIMENLKKGVRGGKQFPFRYMSAYNAVESDRDVNNKAVILDGLNECLDIACDNLPKLKGKSAFLSDNSGSAWGTCTSEFGKVTVGEIDNLSSMIGAVNSDDGHVFAFGDELIEYPVSKRTGILTQSKHMSKSARKDVGFATENGIWIFFRDAINKKQHWDNIFIYSDMQAGHGSLYGTSKGIEEYKNQGYCIGKYEIHVDVAKLIEDYRKYVNPKVNVFSIQTAGYKNVVVPEYGYRTNILYGWTGKELVFADTMIKMWDEIDKKGCD